MKVGLITFHDTTNFGSLLQTYGLYRAIEKCGAECEVIDYQCKSIVERELPDASREVLLVLDGTTSLTEMQRISVEDAADINLEVRTAEENG